MPRGSNGAYTQPGGTSAVTQTTISSSAYNTLIGDIGTELTNSVDRYGRGNMSAALNMGGHQITNGSAAVNPTDFVIFSQLSSSGSYLPAGSEFNATFSGSQFFSPTTTTNLNFTSANPTWGSWSGSVMTLNTAGLYLVSSNININATYSGTTTGALASGIYHNGSAVSQAEDLAAVGTSYNFQRQIGAIIDCAATDTINVGVYLFNPSGLFNSAYTSGSTNNLQIIKLK